MRLLWVLAAAHSCSGTLAKQVGFTPRCASSRVGRLLPPRSSWLLRETGLLMSVTVAATFSSSTVGPSSPHTHYMHPRGLAMWLYFGHQTALFTSAIFISVLASVSSPTSRNPKICRTSCKNMERNNNGRDYRAAKPRMNALIRYVIVFGIAFPAIIQAHAQGYIPPNGVTYSTAGLSAVIHVMQSPTNGDYTGFILRPQFMTPGSPYYSIFSFDPGAADEGVRTFIASQNDLIGLEQIQAGAYTELALGNDYGFDPSVPFYLGFYTGHTNGASPGAYSNPVFGWGEFVNNQGVIQMMDAALEVDGGGIYVGTQTIIPVPEPGFLSHSACGALILGRRFRRLNPTASGNGATGSSVRRRMSWSRNVTCE